MSSFAYHPILGYIPVEAFSPNQAYTRDNTPISNARSFGQPQQSSHSAFQQQHPNQSQHYLNVGVPTPNGFCVPISVHMNQLPSPPQPNIKVEIRLTYQPPYSYPHPC